MSGRSLLRVLLALCAALALVVLPGLQVAHARSVSERRAPSTRASAGGGPSTSASASELAAPLHPDRRWRLPGKEGAGRRAAARSAASTAPGEAGGELDCIGNVRRLRGGARYGAGAALPSDIGGYKYTAFGRSIAADAGTPAPVVDGVSFAQPLRWQGRWLDTATGIYDVRNRQWSPELGAFLSADEFRFFTANGTLWSWPGQNPLRWKDPSGLEAYSEQQVTTMLQTYSWELSHAPAYPTMLGHHQAGGAFDFYVNQPDDTFDVPGLGTLTAAEFGNFITGFAAGYQADPLALQLVKVAGAWYGTDPERPSSHWSQLFFYGDDWSSVNRINQGFGYGFQTRWSHGPQEKNPVACTE